MYALGFDVGGTKTEAVVYQFEGDHLPKALSRNRISTPHGHGYDAVVQGLADLARLCCKEAHIKLPTLSKIAFSVAASTTDTHIQRGNMSVLDGRSLASDVLDILGVHVPSMMGNDGNCFTLAESLYGAGISFESHSKVPRSQHIALGLTVGSGLGGGLVHGGRALAGARGGALELGHVPLSSTGAILSASTMCYCGHRGCAEQFLSGPALERAFFTLESRNREIRASQIFVLAREGHRSARAAVFDFLDHFSSYLAHLVNICDPHYFVLGGGLGDVEELRSEPVRSAVAQKSFLGNCPEILPFVLDGASGSLGALLLS